jgi:osmotically inducible lipoprotein OsmB
MKKLTISVILAGVLAGVLASCNAYNPRDRAVAGGIIGAGTGAVVGGLATGRPGGAVAGGVIGAAGGAIIGAATTPRRRYARARWCRGYNSYGYLVRYRC